jgi:protein gp37
MNLTSIEWAQNPDGSPGYTWNPITGCLNHVNGLCKSGDFPCYAYKLANGRLKARYLANKHTGYDGGAIGKDRWLIDTDPFYPRFWEEKLSDIERPPYPYSAWDGNACKTTPIEFLPKNIHAKRKAKGIFTCDMSDLFGIGIPEQWTRQVLDAIRINSVDRFYLLTKQPQNLNKFSPFPENCWVGVTATNGKMVDDAGYWLERIDAKVKYLSLEPLLEPIQLYFGKPGINWVIIGACTGSLGDMQALRARYPALEVRDNKTFTKFVAVPPPAWVREIITAADAANVPVFIKDNILDTAWGDYRLTEGRREFPNK